MPLKRLEPYEGKLSRTVLRGGWRSNALSLPDSSKLFGHKYIISYNNHSVSMG